MQEILAEWADDEGNEFVLLSEPDDGDGPRNAARRTPPGNSRRTGEMRGRVAQRPRRSQPGGYSVPPARSQVPQRTTQAPSHGPMQTTPQAQVHIVQTPATIRLQTDKVLRFVEVLGETVAEMVPLPDMPPAPTGTMDVDLKNQNEHRQALHAHRVLTSRIRTGGRVVSKLIRLLTEE